MIYVLNRKFQVASTFSNNGAPGACPYFDDLLKESVALGAASYEFRVPADHPATEHLTEGAYVVRKDLEGNDILFQVMRVEEKHATDRYIYAYAETAGLELLNDIVRPAPAPSTVTADQAFGYILADTNWVAGKVDYAGVEEVEFKDYENALASLQRVAKQFDLELIFRVEMKLGRVVSRIVDVVEERGSRTYKRFEYNKDINDITRTVDISQVATAILPLGKGADSNPLTIKGVVWNTPTHPTNKESADDFLGDEDALERWGVDGKHITVQETFETEDKYHLADLAWKRLQELKDPLVTYELDVALLERLVGEEYRHESVRIGDTVHVIDQTFESPLLLEARVVELETSFSDPTQDKCTLGNFILKKSNISPELRALQQKLFFNEATWAQIGETILKQPTSPTPAEEGQLWLDTSSQPAVIYMYDGAAWIPTSLDPTLIDGIQEQIEAIEITVNGKETLVPKSPTAPANPASGQLWLDISSTPNQLKVYLSGSWEAATPDNTYIEDKVEDAVGKIEIGSRNYVLDSDKWNTGYSQSFEVANGFNDFKGKTITISCEVILENANLNQENNRLGYAPALEFADGTIAYLEAWYYPTAGETVRKRVSKTFEFPDKAITRVIQDGTYIQVSGDYVAVGRPQIEIGNKATDWKPANEDFLNRLDDAVTGLNGDITDLGTALTDFELEVNGSFRDGVVNEAETLVIKSYIEQVNNEKASIDSQYTTVYANVALNASTEKTNLASAKSTYDGAHTQLVTAINTAISDSQVTQVERDNVASKFTAYRTALTAFEQRLQQAIDKIGSVRDSQIQVGGENLISNSAPDNLSGWDAVPAATGTIEVIDEATAPLARAISATFDATMTGVKISPAVTLTNSRSYTWSVWVKASKAVTLTIGNEKGGTKTVAVTTAWARHEMTFTSSTGTAYAMVFNDHTNAMNAGDILYIHSLKLEEGTRATSWSASSREVKGDVQFIREDINNIQQQTSETALTTTIFNSTRYVEDLATKANADDIADMATQSELAEKAGELQEAIDKKADDTRVTQAFEQISQVQQTAQDLQVKIQASGGVNLLKNSVGYANFKGWTKTGTVNALVNEDFTRFGSDSVFEFVNGSISQTVLVETGNLHTFNFVVDKASAGQLTVSILDGNVSVGSQVFANGTAYDHVRHSMTVAVLSNTVTIQLTGTGGQVGVMMLNIGSEPLQWQQAHDEMYTTNVQFDQSGITVKSTAYNGYTVISPDEFAGYAEVIDDLGNASIQRIFTLNGDTTEVKKLKADKEISMGQMKILDVNGTKKGWAFIKNN